MDRTFSAVLSRVLAGRGTVSAAVTKENESSWIFEPCLTCSNALRRVQHPGFSLVCAHSRWRSCGLVSGRWLGVSGFPQVVLRMRYPDGHVTRAPRRSVEAVLEDFS
jgi:hypothetical protein